MEFYTLYFYLPDFSFTLISKRVLLISKATFSSFLTILIRLNVVVGDLGFDKLDGKLTANLILHRKFPMFQKYRLYLF